MRHKLLLSSGLLLLAVASLIRANANAGSCVNVDAAITCEDDPFIPRQSAFHCQPLGPWHCTLGVHYWGLWTGEQVSPVPEGGGGAWIEVEPIFAPCYTVFFCERAYDEETETYTTCVTVGQDIFGYESIVATQNLGAQCTGD